MYKLMVSTAVCAKHSMNMTSLYSTKASVHGVLPRITVPHRMIKRVERMRARDPAIRHRQHQHGRRGELVISCKRPQFNHHLGQRTNDLTLKSLASGGWKHTKSKSDYFTINATQSNPALQSTVESFDQFGFHKQLTSGLAKLKYLKPTNIQVKAIPVIMSGKNVLCAAETGSGKTLAYLLPMVDKIFRYRSTYGPSKAPNRPHGIIITPSRELADQIYDVAQLLSEFVPLATDIKCGGRGTQRILRQMPENIVDLLVTTPGVFSKLLTNKLYDLSRLSHIVLDEADTLLDDSFSSLSLRLLQKLKEIQCLIFLIRDQFMDDDQMIKTSSKFIVRLYAVLLGSLHNSLQISGEGQATLDLSGVPICHGIQVAFVGATLPRDIENILKDIVPFDTVETVTTSHVHRLLPHVPQKFLRVGLSQRPERLLTLMKSNVSRKIPTLIFCNESSTACFLGYFLESNNIPNVVLHANMPEVVRNGRFSKFQNGECNVLVCTDIASRGLDTIRARHVVNYEFPNFISDYIHRVGRVGRVGSAGACLSVSFISYDWDVDLLWKIESAARLKAELPNVNANIKRKLTAIVHQKFGQQSDLVDA